MRTIQGNVLSSLRNAQTFLAENSAVLGDVISGGAGTMLDAVITELEEHAATQDGHTRLATGAVASQRARRRALIRDHMTPIDRIARLLLLETPELVALRLPRGKPSVERLVALAGGMAEAAAPYAELFVEAGRKPTFIEDLHTAAGELLETLQDRAMSRSKVRTATSALQTRLAHGRRVVHVLDALVQSALVDDPALLAGWRLAKRVRQPHGSRAVVSDTLPARSDGAAEATLEPLRLAA